MKPEELQRMREHAKELREKAVMYAGCDHHGLAEGYHQLADNLERGIKAVEKAEGHIENQQAH